MALEDWGPMSLGGSLCKKDGCERDAVVVDADDDLYRPLCFLHAFAAALESDEEAQKLARGYVVAHSLSDPYVPRRRS